MKKKTLFLSAALSTFILVVVAGVIKANSEGLFAALLSATPTQIPVAQVLPPTDTPTDPPTAAPTNTLQPTVSPYLSPEEAVALASARLGSKDVYSIDTVSLAQMDVYKVTFSSGYVVYVSPEGHILTITAPVVVVSNTSSGGGGSGQQQPSKPSGGGGDGGGDDGGGDN